MRRRFTPNELLSPASQDSFGNSLAFLKRMFRRTTKPSWIYSSVRKLANFVSVFWWITGIRGSEVIVVSSVPTTFQSSVLNNLCRALGKQVVLCLHGTDGRPPFLNGLYFDYVVSLSGEKLARYIAAFRRRVAGAADKSTAVISWMGCSHYIPGKTFLFEEVGFPVFSGPAAAVTKNSEDEGMKRDLDRPLRVLHAPSSTGKGSAEIRKVIEELIAEGHAFVFEEIKNAPNTEVLDKIAGCDLVVDQIYSDNFAGVIAREAGLMSRWVIVGGDSLDHMRTIRWELPPVFTSSPKSLRNDLLWCEENRELLDEKARHLRSHFENRNFTKFFVATFLNPSFDRAMMAPSQPRAPFLDFHPGLGGYGSKAEIQLMLQSLVDAAGIAGLGLPKVFSEELLAHYEISI